MEIGFLKTIIEYFNGVEEYLDEISEEFDFVDCPAEYKNDYLDRVEKYLETDKLNCGFNQKMADFIEKNRPLYEYLAKYKGDNKIGKLLHDITSDKVEEFISLLSFNSEKVEDVYNTLVELEKLGITYLELGINKNYNYGISPDFESGSTAISYMNPVELTKGPYPNSYKPIVGTDFELFVSLYEDPDKIYYGDTIFVENILDFDVNKIPRTVEEVKKYIDVIKKKQVLFDQKDGLKEIVDSYEEFLNSYNKMSKVIASHKIYNDYDCGVSNKIESLDFGIKKLGINIDEYVDKESALINNDDEKIVTDGITVRI